MTDWEKVARNLQSGEHHPERPGDAAINPEGLALLGLDNQTQLYWDGKPVVITQRLTLSRWQRVWAAITATAIIFGGLGALAMGVNSAHNFGCKLEWWSVGCPRVAPPAPVPEPRLVPPSRSPGQPGRP